MPTTSDEPEPEFSSSSRAELWRFPAEPSRAGALQFPSWNRAEPKRPRTKEVQKSWEFFEGPGIF